VTVGEDLLQELAEQFLTGLLLLRTQTGPQLGLVGVQEQQSRLVAFRTASRQLHENLLVGETLQQ
jgi:hypothetical protein